MRLAGWLWVPWMLSTAATAAACPVCRTDGGDAVRAGIAAMLASGMAATLLPFAPLALVVVLVRRGWPRPREDA